MSFLEKVITLSEKIELDMVVTKLTELEVSSKDLECGLLKYMENVYIRETEAPKKISLLDKTTNLTSIAYDLRQNIDTVVKNEVVNGKVQVQEYANKLGALEHKLNICSSMCKMHESLLLIKKLQLQNALVKAMEECINIENYINYNQTGNVELVKDIKVKLHLQKQVLISSLQAVVNNHLSYTCSDNINIITIKKTEVHDMNDVLQVLNLANLNVTVIDNFIKYLWNMVFTIIVNNTTKVVSERTDELTTLKLTFNKNQKDCYIIVFNNIITVVEFLFINFNYKLSEQKTTLDYIGENIRDNLSELIIVFCLNDTIPSTFEKLQEYKDVITQTEILQQKLIDMHIFTKDTTSILDHANNIDILFINKKCQDYRNRAIELLEKDLHIIESVGKVVDPTNPFPSDEFAQCSISVSVLEILKLIEIIFVDATKASNVCAEKLYTTANKILYHYGSAVIEYHGKLLQTIPQQVAIFYNNCMYLVYALSLNKWTQLCSKLPGLIKDKIPFQDAIIELKKIGHDKFHDYVQTQCQQIEGIVKESAMCSVLSYEKIDPNTEKLIRQCLRQQELLKTVWQKVLNYYEYNNTIGIILNSLCTSLVDAVLKAEDISAEASNNLEDIFKLVLTRGPKLFTEPKEINLYVENWYKLSELVFILNSSLINICDRWADGKGPLALQFKPEEIKGLIRALFQNSDKRAAVLDRIVKML